MKKNIIGKSIDKVFYSITKNKSNQEYKNKLRKMQKDGRELTKEEKKEIRHQIVQKNSKACKRRAKAIGLVTGIFALGAVAGAKGKDLLNPAVDGVKYNKWSQETVVNLDEIQGELNITGSKAKQFREEQAKAAITNSTENQDKEKIANMKNKKEEISITNKDQLLEYIKKEYVEEYKKATGDNEITTEDIKIIRSNQDYVMELQDGTVVTHGNTPDSVTNKLEDDGYSYDIKYKQKVYLIKGKDNKAFDGVTIMQNEEGDYEVRRVVAGDSYEMMINSDSVACDISRLITNGMDGVSEWDNNMYRKLAINAVESRESYKNAEKTTQITENIDNER